MTINRRMGRPALVALALAGALLMSACSQGEDPAASDLVADAQAQDYAAQQASQSAINKANRALPARPSGRLDIDGTTAFTLTSEEVERYNATGTATTISLGANTEDQAFQELCSGQIDLVDSQRSITRSEWDACQAVGLDVVQFQIASEGIVIATKSESDLGGDCLSTDQVKQIWRAGSPITDWSQLGLDDVSMAVGGPSVDGSQDGFQQFGKTVLGSQVPSETDLRSDYVSYDRFDQARIFLNGGPRRAQLAQTYPDRARQLGLRKSELVTSRQVLVDTANELRIASAERAKGIRDNRNAADQLEDAARVQSAEVAAAKARGAANTAHGKYTWAKRQADTAAAARRKVERSLGHVIYARFGSYELYEEELRPFEITTPDGHRNCVFPSQTTIASGSYPLSTQILLTTTTRSLERHEVTDFLKHYLRSAQDAADEAALIGLTDATLHQELQWLEGTSQPVLVAPVGDEPDPDAPIEPGAPAR